MSSRDMSKSDFWSERVARYGHPGWMDPVVYAFDQEARLFAVEKLARQYGVRADCSLDFGCGTGGFSRLLTQWSQRVIGFDITTEAIAIARQSTPKSLTVEYRGGGSITELGLAPNSVDFVLTVTVLDHIMDD